MSQALTHKQIAKRLKSMSKGKEHLYCQFCHRQFRDNTTGFQTHKSSKEHLDNVQEFMKDPQYYIKRWSAEFEKLWNEIVSFRYRNKEVRVTVVYDEFTATEDHVRLQATKWKELMDFVRDWARRNQDKVTLTQKAGAYFVRWEESDEEASVRRFGGEVQSKKRKRTELERQMSEIRRQVKAARKEEEEIGAGDVETSQESGASSSVTKAKPSFGKMSIEAKADNAKVDEPLPSVNIFQSPQNAETSTTTTTAPAPTPAPTSHYLPGIIVRVMNKKLATGEYHKKKGALLKIIPGKEQPLLQLEMQPSGDVIQVPEKQVETVIPNLQREVLCLRGAHRGKVGVLLELQKDRYCGLIRLNGTNEEVSVPYDDFSKRV